MSTIDFIQLSKIVSHALRHEPELYNLRIDKEGWVSLSELITSLNEKGLNVTSESITEMLKRSEKKRHEILNGKIRAFYGHSTEQLIAKNRNRPPEILYHGTVSSNVKSILENGIHPMKRQYAHLSTNEDTAKRAAERRPGEIVIIKIKAQNAHDESNVEFYAEANGIWLAKLIPSKYLYF